MGVNSLAKMNTDNASPALTLMGSGEMTPGMARVHRALLARGPQPARPVFVDTPAGFELNCAGIAAKAVEYFQEQFDLPLDVASFPNAVRATQEQAVAAMRALRRATYIFSGPGSPTYAVRHWRETPVFETVAAMLHAGAAVTFASAAALAVGRFTLPVYEIYKVGEEPHWIEGLDLLGRYGLDLAVVPHWNNNSGGSHDTSRAYIGAERFEHLRAALPPSTVVLGIDEYTACTIEFTEKRCTVSGAGGVTVLHADGASYTFASGESFSTDLLTHAATAVANDSTAHDDVIAAFRTVLADRDAATALSHLHGLMDHLARFPHDAAAQKHTLLLIREMTAELAVWLEAQQMQPPAPPADDGPWIDLIVSLRGQARTAKAWAISDAVRNALTERGIVIEDGASGSTWRRG
jgi:hypothetical protein